MAKKIKANKTDERLIRSYWMLMANGETQHCHWKGSLKSGAPRFEHIRDTLGVGWIRPVTVLYRGQKLIMFVDDEVTGGPFNWKASMLLANGLLIDVRGAPRYDDLTEDPPLHPLSLITRGWTVIGDVMLWEGGFDDTLPFEGPVPSILDKIKESST